MEYKAIPQNRPNGPPSSDPRNASSLWLYEEFIPNDYKSELAQPKRKLHLPNLTLPFSSKQPYNLGSISAVSPGGPLGQGYTARLPSARELEFEGLLQREASTKIISLGHGLTVSGAGAGARESTMSASLSASELGHANVSEIGHGQGSGEYSTQYVDGSREGSGGPYVPTVQGTSSAHVSSSIAPDPNENQTGTDVRLANMLQHPTSTTAPISAPSQNNVASNNTAPQTGFFTAMTTPRKSPARFLAKMGKGRGGNGGGGGGGSGEGSGGLFGDDGGQGVEKAKRGGKDKMRARHSILRKGWKGSEETSVEFETRTIFGVDEGSDGDDDPEGGRQNTQVGDNDGSTPTQVKFPRAYSHARNISKDDAWVDILVAGSSGNMNATTMAAATPIRPRRSSDPESAGLSGSSYHLHDPDRVREEIRQALKGAGPKPAEFSDNEADDVNLGLGRASLSTDHSVDDGNDQYPEDDGDALYGLPEPPRSEGPSSDFINGATNAGRVSLSASLPHGQGNGHHHTQLPSSTGSSGMNVNPVTDLPHGDANRDSSPFSLSVPEAGSRLGSKAALRLASRINTSIATNLDSPIQLSQSAELPQPVVLANGELNEVPEIDDTDSQLPDDGSSLGEPTDLLSGLAVNPATPRYIHGAPLHNVVEEEEE